MEDVARQAGVSRSLVSLVMRESPKVSEHSRAAVLTAAEELGYRPNLMARNLASRRTHTIGLILNDLHNPFFAEVTDGIQAVATEVGYRIVINTGLRSLAGETQAVDTFLQFRTDGIILGGPWMPDDQLVSLADETPIVVVGRRLATTACDTVNTDDELGAALVIDHLVELGHRCIAHIDGGIGAGAAERRAGYEDAMRRHGLDEHIRTVEGDFDERSGYDATGTLLDSGHPLTAIFAANDLSATGALDRLEAAGLRVPDDISLVGFDNTALAALRHIALSTVNQPRDVLGRLAVTSLLERLDHDRSPGVHHLLAPSLVPRRTSGPVPG